VKDEEGRGRVLFEGNHFGTSLEGKPGITTGLQHISTFGLYRPSSQGVRAMHVLFTAYTNGKQSCS